jgi:hypothetical protein
VTTTSISQNLAAAIAKINRPGTYCTSGTVPAVLPGLEVAELGPIAGQRIV